MRNLFILLSVFNSFASFSQNTGHLDVTWIDPNPIKYNDGIIITSNELLKLEFIIKTAQNETTIKNNLRILVNGVDLREGKKTLGVTEIKKKEQECLISQQIYLPEDKNIIEIELAMPGQAKLISKKLEVNYLTEEKAHLYVVSVGVSSNLKFTKIDAESIFNIFNGQFASVFQTVRGELLVCPENTTKAKIATTIEKIKYQQLRRNDVLILFLSGHGTNSLDDSDDFYLATSDANTSISKYSLLSYQKDVIENLKDLDCKRIILIDACQSGAARSNGQKTGAIDFERIQRIISQTPPSIITLASSSSNESSWEDNEWGHGAFTKAILDGLSKGADKNNDAIIWVKEMVDYVVKKVPELTANKPLPQHPQLINEIKNDFPIFNFTRQNKTYKPLTMDCLGKAGEKSATSTSVIALIDNKSTDWNLTDKIKEKIKFLVPEYEIDKLPNENLVKSGIIGGLKAGNTKLAEKLPKDVGNKLLVVSRKTTFSSKSIVGQVIWNARTYLHFTEIDTKSGKILNSYEADEAPTVKSDPNKQKAEQMSINLTLNQLSDRYFK